MKQRSITPVIIWLISGIILVASMVVIGGITRLTHSGLSMVEWDLVMGSVPPMNEAEWQATFEKYQTSPEYQKINFDFELADFKTIFWWEYIHRVMGRLIGIVFIIPFIIFLIQKRFDKPMIWKMVGLLLLGGFQGFMGWYMVKSGLVNNPFVSHFRLAAHLLTAFLICSYIFWLILDLIGTKSRVITVKAINSVLSAYAVLIVIQIAFGAFVAGLKAGMFYPTFPLMAGELIPGQIALAYAEFGMASWFNDLTTVQFIHRWLGMLALFGVLGIWLNYGNRVTGQDKKSINTLVLLVLLQSALGIITLIYGVPLVPAILHQIIALLVLLVTVWNLHNFRNRYELAIS
jgi:cytochrome c oxidase assembly protein subunit 15